MEQPGPTVEQFLELRNSANVDGNNLSLTADLKFANALKATQKIVIKSSRLLLIIGEDGICLRVKRETN